MPRTPHSSSYYAASANPAPLRPEPQGEVETDVCVIGAGYVDLSIALFLSENGFKVAILEAVKVGSGVSGRNDGQIVNSYSRDINVIERIVDRREAQLLGETALEGGHIIRERVIHYGIQCDPKDGGVLVVLIEKQMDHLRAQKQLWEHYDHNQLEIMDAKRIRGVAATDNYIGGILDTNGGHIQPLSLTLGEAAAVGSLDGRIYEQSPMTRTERGVSPVVHTPQGKVKAKFIVVVGNVYPSGLVLELAAKSIPCGTQIITTEPLNEELTRSPLPQDYCVEDCNYLLDYCRLSGGKRLIYGGGVIYGAHDSADIGVIARPKMLKTFPQLKDVKIDFAWTGNLLLTLLRLPQVGCIGDNIYCSQGCSGHGVTYTHVAGKVLAEALRGQAERFDAFAGLPHYPFPGGKLFRIPFTVIGAWYYNLCDEFGA